MLDRIDAAVHVIGRWLRQNGYLGAFGVDFLLVGDELLFTEINPRFQGSTHLSGEISTREGQACIVLEHLAACLQIDAPEPLRLRDIGRLGGSHIVVHSNADARVKADGAALAATASAYPGVRRCDVLARADLDTDPGATVARVTTAAGVTTNGFGLAQPWADLVSRLEVR